MNWRIHHKATTDSTNRDALGGTHGDVYTADRQTAGRGRLDHKWLSPPGENLMMSAVVDVAGMDASAVSTLPLVAGLAVAEALEPFAGALAPRRVGKTPDLRFLKKLPDQIRPPSFFPDRMIRERTDG